MYIMFIHNPGPQGHKPPPPMVWSADIAETLEVLAFGELRVLWLQGEQQKRDLTEYTVSTCMVYTLCMLYTLHTLYTVHTLYAL